MDYVQPQCLASNGHSYFKYSFKIEFGINDTLTNLFFWVAQVDLELLDKCQDAQKRTQISRKFNLS